MSLSDQFVPVDFTDSKTPHDRVLIVEGQKFYVFAGHLSFCSEYFRILFYSNFKEKSQDEIKIEELPAEDFHYFLKTLDPYAKAAITADNYLTIMACGNRFLAPGTIIMCEQFIVDNYKILDVHDLLNVAIEFNWKELKDNLESSLVKKFKGIVPCYRRFKIFEIKKYEAILKNLKLASENSFLKLKEVVEANLVNQYKHSSHEISLEMNFNKLAKKYDLPMLKKDIDDYVLGSLLKFCDGNPAIRLSNWATTFAVKNLRTTLDKFFTDKFNERSNSLNYSAFKNFCKVTEKYKLDTLKQCIIEYLQTVSYYNPIMVAAGEHLQNLENKEQTFDITSLMRKPDVQ